MTGLKTPESALEASTLYQLQGDRGAILRYFHTHPDLLDPKWEKRNPDHPDAQHAHMLRWQFCLQLSNGDYVYRARNPIEKASKWPSDKNEILALEEIKNTNDPRQAAMLVVNEPWLSELSLLLPSALQEYKKGNLKAVFDLSRIMPGLLQTESDSKPQGVEPKGFREYMVQLQEFQACFRQLAKDRKIRVTKEAKHPAEMKKRCYTVEELIKSGLDKNIVYAVLKRSGSEYDNIITERSIIKNEIQNKEDRWFHGGSKLEREFREKGGVPHKITLAQIMACWIETQYWFRLRVQATFNEIKQFLAKQSQNETLSDVDTVALYNKCRAYADNEGVFNLLPSAEDLAESARNYWPGLRTFKTEYDPIEIAACLLKAFKALNQYQEYSDVISIPRAFHNAATILAVFGTTGVDAFLQETRQFIARIEKNNNPVQ